MNAKAEQVQIFRALTDELLIQSNFSCFNWRTFNSMFLTPLLRIGTTNKNVFGSVPVD